MSDQCTFEIPNNAKEARRIQMEIVDLLTTQGWPSRIIMWVRLAIEEAFINAIKHGNQGDANKKVFGYYHITGEYVEVTIKDEGKGFIPEDVPDPTLPENLEKPGGRGVFLMREVMDEVTYNAIGNQVTFKRNRHSQKATAS